MLTVKIRKATESDDSKIYEINRLAFGQETESILVEKLCKRSDFIEDFSLVATIDDEVVGHILFSKIKIVNDKNSFDSLALAPMSVLPNFQKKGIGVQLITIGLQQMKSLGFKSVVVLGHPKYYPKFGFQKASYWKITCPFPVPDEAFMAVELVDNELINKNGKVEYPKEFYEI